MLRETPGSSRRSSPLNAGEPWRALAWGVRWFRELPLATKVLAAAPLLLVALAILLLLRRLGVALAVLMFVVCLVALIVRAARGRQIKGWGAGAAASLILLGVLWGAEPSLWREGPAASNPSEQVSTPDDGGVQQETLPEHGDVAPGLDKLADRWASSNIKSAIFIPSQLPYPPEKVGYSFTDSGFNSTVYYIKGWNYLLTLTYVGHPGDDRYRAGAPGVQTLTRDDGPSYYYIIEKEDSYHGSYSVAFWDEDTFVYRLETPEGSILGPELFMGVLESMVRVESRASA